MILPQSPASMHTSLFENHDLGLGMISNKPDNFKVLTDDDVEAVDSVADSRG